MLYCKMFKLQSKHCSYIVFTVLCAILLDALESQKYKICEGGNESTYYFET